MVLSKVPETLLSGNKPLSLCLAFSTKLTELPTENDSGEVWSVVCGKLGAVAVSDTALYFSTTLGLPSNPAIKTLTMLIIRQMY